MPRTLALNGLEITDEFFAELQAQDAELRFERFEHADAVAVGLFMLRAAQDRAQSFAASVWLGDQSVFHFGLAGTAADHDLWLARKAAVVRRYDRSSFLVASFWAEAGAVPGPAIGVDAIGYAFAGGAVPIRVGSTQVGVVAATGVDDFAEHALAVEALRAHLIGGTGAV